MHDFDFKLDPGSISDEEWHARCELAALYRLIAHFRWTDHLDTHVSVRVPNEDDHFLINRYGVMFHEMRARDLIKVNHAGDVVDTRANPGSVNRAGFNIHSALHLARADINCVIHTHTAAGIAVSAQAEGLLPISQHALKFHRRLGYHDYEGLSLIEEERGRLSRDLGPHMAMILRNHGLIAAGGCIAEAFYNLHFLERACQAQVLALAGGRELNFPPKDICERAALQEESAILEGQHLLAWEAALRLIARDDDDYRI
ncbi:MULTISPECIES: class II aldolase/adducin family protein [Pseudomonas]|uniref:Aldolase n=1 Tax=Pseudomonas fulva TaxID=47880 RepID=A0A0D0KLD9_9PSED|nr:MULTISPECIES: class II aldolase/adducin family protein [Pseudomonas]KIQ00232.1 aldolase [Pseudomonas fulva]